MDSHAVEVSFSLNSTAREAPLNHLLGLLSRVCPHVYSLQSLQIIACLARVVEFN